MSWPRLSVVVPVRDGERFVGEALESVLASGYPDLEIVVVDDGSRDETARVVESVPGPIRLVRQDHAGPPTARNRGLAETTGELVALLDADDRWPAEKLALQLPPLLHGEVDLTLGWTLHFRDRQGDESDPGVEFARAPMFVFQLGCALARRRVFETVGGFAPELVYGDDVDWFLRCREHAVPTCIVDGVTIHYRRHDRNMTRVAVPGHQGLSPMAMLKRSLDRRRADGDGEARPFADRIDVDGPPRATIRRPR